MLKKKAKSEEVLAYLNASGPQTVAHLYEQFGHIHRRLKTLEERGCIRRRLEDNPNKGEPWARTYRVLVEPTGTPLPPTKQDNPKAYYRLWYALNRASKPTTKSRALATYGEWAKAFGFINHEEVDQ